MEDSGNKKSDVGFLETPVDVLKEIRSLMDLEKKYESSTDRIHGLVQEIFENYLLIGSELLDVKNLKIYEIHDFENIFDYAKSEFDLSETTVKNIMAISERFCDGNGNLLEEYQGFSYSSLVELLSVNVDRIGQFTPSMTVKEIRKTKNLMKIDSLIDKTFYGDGFFSSIVEYFSNFNFNDFFETQKNGFVLEYETEKMNYKSSFSLHFHLLSKYFVDGQIDFRVSTWDLERFYLQFDIKTLYLGSIFFGTLEGLKLSFPDYLRKLKGTSILKTDVSEDVSSSPKSFVSVQNVPESGHPSIKSFLSTFGNFVGLINKWLLKEFSGFFCDEPYSSSGVIEFYRESKRHYKKNPMIFKVIRINDPLNMKLVLMKDGVDKDGKFCRVDGESFPVFRYMEDFVESGMTQAFQAAGILKDIVSGDTLPGQISIQEL